MKKSSNQSDAASHMPVWRRLLHASPVDLEGLVGIFSKFSNSFSYLVSAVLAGVYLSPQERGVFFTFLSFSVINVIVELGLNTVIIQFASHEKAIADESADPVERAGAASRLVSIGRFAFIWFWAGAVTLFLCLAVGGYWFFSGEDVATVALPGPWITMSAAIALDLLFFPCWSLLEGVRRIHTVYLYRSTKALVVGASTGLCLVAGLNVWALPIGLLATVPLSAWFVANNWFFFQDFLSHPAGAGVNWRDEMLPLQWRLATSWLAGYASNWAITPIALKLFGPVVAGQVGLTWTVMIGISTIASATITVKFSRFGQMVATHRFAELDRSVLKQGATSAFLAFLGSGTALLLYWLAELFGYRFVNRLLPLDAFAILMTATALHQLTYPMALYLRAFKREPLLWISVVEGILFVMGFVVLGRLLGTFGVAVGYFSTIALVELPVVSLIFVYCRKAWAKGPAAIRLPST